MLLVRWSESNRKWQSKDNFRFQGPRAEMMRKNVLARIFLFDDFPFELCRKQKLKMRYWLLPKASRKLIILLPSKFNAPYLPLDEVNCNIIWKPLQQHAWLRKKIVKGRRKTFLPLLLPTFININCLFKDPQCVWKFSSLSYFLRRILFRDDLKKVLKGKIFVG